MEPFPQFAVKQTHQAHLHANGNTLQLTDKMCLLFPNLAPLYSVNCVQMFSLFIRGGTIMTR